MAHLTAAQLVTLKAAIVADPVLSAQPMNADGHFAIAQVLNNQTANPAFTVWKQSVTVTEIGDNIVAVELAGLSSLNNTRLQTLAILSANGVNPSLADRRAFFDDVFSGAGGVLTRAKLLLLWKRLATRIERMFATGTGSDVSPATIVVTSVDQQDVESARNLP